MKPVKVLLPRDVQILVKQLAGIQQMDIALQYSGAEGRRPPEVIASQRVRLVKDGDKVIAELLANRFVAEMPSIGGAEGGRPDRMRKLGSWLLGRYAVERTDTESAGEKHYDEELFYAGALLIRRAMLSEEETDTPEK